MSTILSMKLISNVLHFILVPYLWYSDKYGNFKEDKSFPTNNDQINKITNIFIKSSKFDHLIKSIFHGYKILDHYVENDLIHVVVDTTNKLSIKQLSDKLFEIDPDGYAPDLWMEGDLSITDKIEFVPRVYKLFNVLDNGEKTINLSKIPKSDLYL